MAVLVVSRCKQGFVYCCIGLAFELEVLCVRQSVEACTLQYTCIATIDLVLCSGPDGHDVNQTRNVPQSYSHYTVHVGTGCPLKCDESKISSVMACLVHALMEAMSWCHTSLQSVNVLQHSGYVCLNSALLLLMENTYSRSTAVDSLASKESTLHGVAWPMSEISPW